MMSLVGEMIVSTINANMFTYEVAPVFNLMEENILKLMRNYCGWTTGDGLLAPGGALSNLYAVLAARHRAFPDVKQFGLPSDTKLAIVISKHVKFQLNDKNEREHFFSGFCFSSVITRSNVLLVS